jgi:hypothetical protein
MPRNAQGLFSLVPGVNPVVPDTLIDANWANPTLNDVAQALSTSIASDGQTAPTGNLPMAGFHHTNVGLAVANTDYARASQVQDGTIIRCTGESGLGDAYTANIPFGQTTFVNGQMIVIKFPMTNAGTTPTLNINGSAAWPILREDGSAIVAGDCRPNVPSRLMWNDTAWLLLGAVVSASSVAGVTSWNSRTGVVTMTLADVTTALAYTPANKAGDTFTGPVVLPGNAATSLQATPLQQVQAMIAAIPTVSGVSSWNGRSGVVTMTGTDVVSALGYTPANKAGETFTGTVTGTTFRAADGSVSAPSIGFNADWGVGLYRSGYGGSSAVGVSCGLYVNSVGNAPVVIIDGSGGANIPRYILKTQTVDRFDIISTGDGSAFRIRTMDDAGAFRANAMIISRIDGSVSFSGPITSATSFKMANGSAAAPSVAYADETNTGFYKPAAGMLDITLQGAPLFRFQSGWFTVGSAQSISWGDTILGRPSAGLLIIGDGGGNYRDLRARYLTANAFTQAAQFSAPSSTIDYNNGQHQYYALPGNITITINNVPNGSMLRLIVGATNGGTVTWVGNPQIWWAGGAAPNLATGPQKYAICSFVNIGGAMLGNASAH